MITRIVWTDDHKLSHESTLTVSAAMQSASHVLQLINQRRLLANGRTSRPYASNGNRSRSQLLFLHVIVFVIRVTQ